MSTTNQECERVCSKCRRPIVYVTNGGVGYWSHRDIVITQCPDLDPIPLPDHLRPGTFREWQAVLRREQASLSLGGKLALAVTLIRAGLKLGGVSKEEWRRRMTICQTCPIFDPSLFRCRPFDGAPQGCGCYMKFKAWTRGACWVKQNFPDSGLGWD